MDARSRKGTFCLVPPKVYYFCILEEELPSPLSGGTEQKEQKNLPPLARSPPFSAFGVSLGNPVFSPEDNRRVRRYQMRRLGLSLGADVLAFAVTAAFLAFAPRGGWPLAGGLPPLAGALYLAFMLAARAGATLPLDYLSGFRLPHSAGLSNQTLGDWLLDQAKGFALQLILGGLAAAALIWVMMVRPAGWWWVAGLLGGGLGAVLALIGPVLLDPLFFRFKPLSDSVLADRLAALLRRTRARVRGGVWEMDLSRKSRAANAALVGWGPSRRVVLSDTLLAEYAGEEVEAVLAHEVAHQLGWHIPQMLLVRGALLFSGLYLAEWLLARPAGLDWMGISLPSSAAPASLPAVWLTLSVWGSVWAPVLRAYSRGLERGCDAFAVENTRGTGGLASALEKLCRKNLADPSPPRWVVGLFHTHPAPADRIRWARQREARE